MGEVWIAHHLSLGEDVALKILSRLAPGDVESPLAASARFHFEAKVAARLSRKTRHIVRVTDHGEEEDLAYLVMELLDGETLERRLSNRRRMTPNEVVTLVSQLARALTEAHAEGVIHRDLKPSNVFVTVDEDGGPLFKLLDFGIARTIHTHTAASMFATGRGLIFGTPGYMSPEQVLPGCHLDHHCDLWALATVAYESLTGELPLGGTQPQELVANLRAHRLVPVHERNPSLPGGIGSFFSRAFANRVEDRYASAADLARGFTAAVQNGGAGVAAPATGAARAGGRTISITFPMRFRRRRAESDRATHSRSGSRVLFAASLALLLGAPATSIVSRALHASSGAVTAAPASTALEYAASEAVFAPRGSSEPPAPSPDESAARAPTTASHPPIATKTNPPPSAPDRAPAQGDATRASAWAGARPATSTLERPRETTTPEPRQEQAPASRPPSRKPFDKSEIL